ncbi:reverse transcriptase [Blumeria hordei DH14]|uniref:Reverse transcriptase n=1 Tax=Blumeria graminis f. sp. hordei (strain DH14) TaxID=546991 RepID=N1JAK1_BLUG1|nr:reverse transcriptase [Blumeria hordei DH14]
MPDPPPPPIPPSVVGAPTTLTETLNQATSAANTRTQEATLLFGSVAAALDNVTCDTAASTIPLHLQKTYNEFLTRMQAVAQEFFENHVRGVPIPATNTHLLTAQPKPVAHAKASYANVARKSKGNTGVSTPQKPKPANLQKQAKPLPLDDRLFLRLDENATERLISAYSLLHQLRNLLGENSAMLKEVQHVPSGLGIEEGRFPGVQGIEKAQNLDSYIITSVPRTYTTLDKNNRLVKEPITPELVLKELKKENGFNPTVVVETKGSIASPYYPSAKFIARFPTGSRLPRRFRLFGMGINYRKLSKKVNIAQCGRCFQWHNQRICARTPRCRLCDSVEHTEETHKPCGPHQHPCPSRCIHCHGPHPADAPECPLRPRLNGIKLIKGQVAQIHSTSTAARIGLCTTVGCIRGNTTNTSVDEEMTDTPSGQAPIYTQATNPSGTTPGPLMLEGPLSSTQLVRNTSPSPPLPTVFLGNRYAVLDVEDELALTFANEERFDIVLIQEPYIYTDQQRQITKFNSNYECFTPTDDWSSRPRVLTYIRKGAGLQVCQQRPIPLISTAARDLLLLGVTAPSGARLLVVNVYNAPAGSNNGGEAVRALLNLTFPGHSNRIFLAEDLNLRHTWWQASSQTTSLLAEPFIEWTDRLNITLISESDMPTHKCGSVLDLALASSPQILAGAESSIIPELDVTSDHLPIASLIPWDCRFQEPIPRLKLSTLDERLFLSLLELETARLIDLPANPQPSSLDLFAQSICTALQNAYRASARRALGKGTGQPCSTDQNAITAGKKLLRAAVRRAKQKLFQDKIDQANTAKDVFGMVNWHRTVGSFRTPPLKDPTNPGAPPANTLQEKRNVLARNLLQNASEVADVALDVPSVKWLGIRFLACHILRVITPSVGTASLTFLDLTPAEIKDSVIKAGNTAPGEDEIPTAILKICWPLIETRVSSLFRGCLQAGHHPACFKTAVLVMLNKPNKPDRSSPRSYRPIALLLTLGKGLERLIARRLSWIAIRHKIVASQHFGAVPLCSATDLTTCLVHDIETALNSKLTASLLTLDVKGAFDGVLPGRLALRLRDQGWPDNLVRWVASFTSNRAAKTRLDGSTGPEFDVPCGLPQGSPVSPILFMLYLAPLLHMGTPKRRFGYAYDIAFLHTSRPLKENAENLSQKLQETIQ